ncbi:MAG TPA: hypothetical protein VJ721_07205 [Chthoniobacterales bacterium]|nr:hypothetical protein [Chthoniobacterales bacterium]
MKPADEEIKSELLQGTFDLPALKAPSPSSGRILQPDPEPAGASSKWKQTMGDELRPRLEPHSART